MFPSVSISAVRPSAASGPGALDGFEYDCTCGGGHKLSLKTLATQWRTDHINWHLQRGDAVFYAA